MCSLLGDGKLEHAPSPCKREAIHNGARQPRRTAALSGRRPGRDALTIASCRRGGGETAAPAPPIERARIHRHDRRTGRTARPAPPVAASRPSQAFSRPGRHRRSGHPPAAARWREWMESGTAGCFALDCGMITPAFICRSGKWLRMWYPI